MPNQNKKPSLYLYTLPRSITKLLLWGLPAIIISAFLALSLVLAWTEPTVAPPGGNVPAPINVSGTAQIKSGPLQVNGFYNIGDTIFDGDVTFKSKLLFKNLQEIRDNNFGGLYIGTEVNRAINLAAGGAITLSSGQDLVGIGTTNPIADLDIQGEYDTNVRIISTTRGKTELQIQRNILGGNAAASIYIPADSPDLRIWNNADAITIQRTTGYVGIGTLNPGAELEVAGQIKITGGDPVAGKVLTSDDSGLASWQSAAAGTSYWTQSGSTLKPNDNNWNVRMGGNNDGAEWKLGVTGKIIQRSGDVALAVDSGNVGIGTTGPWQKLDVNGNIRAAGSAGAGYVYLGNRGYYIGDDLGGFDIQTNAPNIYVYDGGWKRLLREGDITAGIGGSGTANYIPKFTTASTLGNSLIYDNGTKVGIGTTSPGVALDVNGDIRTSAGITLGGVRKIAWPAVSASVQESSGYNCGTAKYVYAQISCPPGYIRTGCSGRMNKDEHFYGAYPLETYKCEAFGSGNAAGDSCVTVYAYCIKVE